MKRFLVKLALIVLTVLLLLAVIGAQQGSAQSRDFGIDTEFNNMFQVHKPYELKVSILFGTCESAEIWIKIPENETVTFVAPSQNYVVAQEEEPGYFTGTFLLQHTEDEQLPLGSKGIVKEAMIGIGCYGQEPTWLETKDVGILIPPMKIYLPLVLN
jgi:hypothetical protein